MRIHVRSLRAVALHPHGAAGDVPRVGAPRESIQMIASWIGWPSSSTAPSPTTGR